MTLNRNSCKYLRLRVFKDRSKHQSHQWGWSQSSCRSVRVSGSLTGSSLWAENLKSLLTSAGGLTQQSSSTPAALRWFVPHRSRAEGTAHLCSREGGGQEAVRRLRTFTWMCQTRNYTEISVSGGFLLLFKKNTLNCEVTAAGGLLQGDRCWRRDKTRSQAEIFNLLFIQQCRKPSDYSSSNTAKYKYSFCANPAQRWIFLIIDC